MTAQDRPGSRLGWLGAALIFLTAVSAQLQSEIRELLPPRWRIAAVVALGLLAGATALFQRAESRLPASAPAGEPGQPPEPGATPEPGEAPARKAAPSSGLVPTAVVARQRWSVGLALALGVGAIFFPILALPGALFAVKAIRGGRTLAGAVTFACVVILGIAGVLRTLAVTPGLNQGPGPVQDQDTVVLNTYFSSLMARCQSGLASVLPVECQAAFNPAGQQQLLQHYGYYACRSQGFPANQCAARLP
jgi:hypothetical protein